MVKNVAHHIQKVTTIFRTNVATKCEGQRRLQGKRLDQVGNGTSMDEIIRREEHKRGSVVVF